MASFTSILDNVGKALKVFFTDAVKVAQIAEPIIDVAFPGFATLYNAGVSEVLAAENAAIAAGSQSGSGAQKLAYVLGSPTFISAVQQFEATASVPFNQTQQTAFINAIVAALDAIPASTVTATLSATAGATASNVPAAGIPTIVTSV
jgi:hypothetical protein